MTNNKQQTGVEWQHIELSKFINGKSEFTDAHDILIKAKEMEKEQIISTYKEGHYHLELDAFNPEQYYNETYGGGEQ